MGIGCSLRSPNNNSRQLPAISKMVTKVLELSDVAANLNGNFCVYIGMQIDDDGVLANGLKHTVVQLHLRFFNIRKTISIECSNDVSRAHGTKQTTINARFLADYYSSTI